MALAITADLRFRANLSAESKSVHAPRSNADQWEAVRHSSECSASVLRGIRPYRTRLQVKLARMEVHLTPEQEARLIEIAETTGRGTDEVMQEAVDNLIAYDAWFREKVRRSMEQADRGEWIEDSKVVAWIEAQEARERS